MTSTAWLGSSVDDNSTGSNEEGPKSFFERPVSGWPRHSCGRLVPPLLGGCGHRRGQLNIVFPNTPLSTTQSFIKGNRDTALRFMRGFTQGLNRLRNDKEFIMKVLSKYTKVTDAETLAQLHQTYGVRYSGDRIPYVRTEGVAEILKRTPGKESREVKAGEFVDDSLLKDLDQSGWFKKLGD